MGIRQSMITCKKEVQDDVQVTLEKVEMLAEQVLGKKIKVENPDVV